MAAGFDLVGMGRALIHDPNLTRKMQNGAVTTSACVPCNECIAEMDRGGVRCTRL
jgi:2,4-dienoyl-CoA reductase-like NADH-dependent reductase (Old Yellow Enzyme family)